MGTTVCADDQHKFHPLSHQLFLSKKTLRQIDIPPRKLLSRRTSADMFVDSPRSADETLPQKFLPYNNCFDDDDEDDADPYSSDHFRIYEFKVRCCVRSRSHDWTDCPFTHPGEIARRRDPRRYNYSGIVCAEFRSGGCSRGDNCEFAHGVFECWLHPARYRTEACKDGKNCKRKVCFFAHTPKQLRVLPSHCNDGYRSPVNSPVVAERKYQQNNGPHCCVYCHCVTASPTTTLIGMYHLSPPMSPSLSPPVSPVKSGQMGGISPISRFGDRLGCVDQLNQVLSYKDALTELMSSLESTSVSENSPLGAGKNREMAWMDFSNFNGDDQQQFILSPSTPIPSGSGHFFSRDCSSLGFTDENGSGGPDLGWVNDLLT